MDDALGNAFVIEMRDLFAQDEIFQQRRAANAGLERILVVADRHALIRGQPLAGRIDANRSSGPLLGIDAERRRAAAEFVGA